MSVATEPVWIIRASYGFEAVKLARETEQCFFYQGGSREVRIEKRNCLDWRGPEKQARELAEKLTEAQETLYLKKLDANNWFAAEKARLIAEQSA